MVINTLRSAPAAKTRYSTTDTEGCTSDSSITSDDESSTNDSIRFLKSGSSAAQECRSHISGSIMVDKVKSYVRDTVFRDFKFTPGDDSVLKLVRQIIKKYRIEGPPDVSATFFSEYWCGYFKRNITACRHNAQTLARKNFIGM